MNERDEQGSLPLELALRLKLQPIAEMLVKNHADIDIVDHSGESLLHKAIRKGRLYFQFYSCFVVIWR